MDDNAAKDVFKLHTSKFRCTAKNDVEEFVVGGEDMTNLFQQITISTLAFGKGDAVGVAVDFNAVVEKEPRFIGRTGNDVDVSIVMAGLALRASGRIEAVELKIDNPMTECVTIHLKEEGLSLKVGNQ